MKLSRAQSGWALLAQGLSYAIEPRRSGLSGVRCVSMRETQATLSDI